MGNRKQMCRWFSALGQRNRIAEKLLLSQRREPYSSKGDADTAWVVHLLCQFKNSNQPPLIENVSDRSVAGFPESAIALLKALIW